MLVVLLCVSFFYVNKIRFSTNLYFFQDGVSEAEYEGFFYPLSCREIEQNVILNIVLIDTFKEGKLFTLELEQLQVTDPEDEITMGRRYLGYFFVTEQTIYRMHVKDYEGFTDEQTRDIVECIKQNFNTFIDMCDIVCSDNEIEDYVDEDGYHTGVRVSGNQRIYYLYNEYTSGTKEYEKIVWEEEKGIVFYERGAGSMLMHIEFGVDLNEVDY